MNRWMLKSAAWKFPGAIVFTLLFSISAAAQFGGSAPSAATPATQLPLSGRGGQGGGVVASESPVASTTTSVNAINPTISVSGAYGGSTNSTAKMPFNGRLSLAEAIHRGTAYNLGAVGIAQTLRQAKGQSKAVRSELLPHFSADIDDTEETINLHSFGFNFNFPGFTLPGTVGPFNVMNFRGRGSEDVFDLTALNNYRASRELIKATELSGKDAEDLVVLAVAGTYLQVIAAGARVDAAQTQLTTATTLYQQDVDRLKFGKIAEIDVNRTRVAMLLDQERLITLQNQLSKQKITLARLVGIPPNENYEITDKLPFTPIPSLTADDAVKQALDDRSDLKSAEAQVEAAKRALAAARAERYPSGNVNADYGEIGTPSQLRPTFTVAATLNIPIWNGGKTSGDIAQAEAALDQRRAELEDTRGQIESDVRSAFLDVEAAANQVEVAQQNLDVNHETLGQTEIKFNSGVSTNVDVVQSQQSVSGAQLDYIDAVFAHNVAKLTLARAMGDAAAKVSQFLNVQQ